jgi:hypothetical protein
MVISGRLERPTLSLKVRCSNQLSYETIHKKRVLKLMGARGLRQGEIEQILRVFFIHFLLPLGQIKSTDLNWPNE